MGRGGGRDKGQGEAPRQKLMQEHRRGEGKGVWVSGGVEAREGRGSTISCSASGGCGQKSRGRPGLQYPSELGQLGGPGC